MLLFENARTIVREILTASDFFTPAHCHIFRTIGSFANEDLTIDLPSIADAMQSDTEVQAVGGAAYLARLGDGVYADAPFKQWAGIILEKSKRRQLMRLGDQLLQDASDESADIGAVTVNLQRRLSQVAGAGMATVIGLRASEVAPRSVRWLWHRWIALGKLTIFDGDPGHGKSTIMIDLAARLSRGVRLPDGSNGSFGGSVICTTEDAADDTVVPRLIAAGADCDKIQIISPDTLGLHALQPRIPESLAAIERAAVSIGARLIFFDPFVAFLSPDVNSHSDQEVRTALVPLAALAERIDVAIVLIRHLNKSNNTNALYRGGGSIGIGAAARSGLLAALDPQDPLTKILAPTKSNLASPPLSLRYRVVEKSILSDTVGSSDVIKTSAVEWLGQSALVAGELIMQPAAEERTAEEEAAEFLQGLLEYGALPSKEIFNKGRQIDISPRTLRRAKKKLGVQARRVGYGRHGVWMWSLSTSIDDQEGSS